MRVGRRIDTRIGCEHLAVGPHEIGNPFGVGDQRACGADRPGELVIAVAEQPERKYILLSELPVLLRGVIRDPKHFDSELLDIGPAVTQLVGFQRSTGGIGLGIEEKKEWVTLEVGARYHAAVVGLEHKVDEYLSNGNHLFISFAVADHGSTDNNDNIINPVVKEKAFVAFGETDAVGAVFQSSCPLDPN